MRPFNLGMLGCKTQPGPFGTAAKKLKEWDLNS